MGRTKFLLASIVTAGAIVSGVLVAGASAPASGTIHVLISQLNRANGGGPVLVVGAIADAGTLSASFDKNGKVDPNGNYVNLLLSKGRIEINFTALSAAGAAATPQLFKATCSAYEATGATTTIVKGTGSYVGITGSIKITETVALSFPRFTSGKNKGQCDSTGAKTHVWGSLVGVGKEKI